MSEFPEILLPTKNGGNADSSECDSKLKVCSTKEYSEEDWYTKLATEAPHIDGLENPFAPIDEIKWLEIPRLERALDFYIDYSGYFLQQAALGMMLVTLSVKRISTVIFQSSGELDGRLLFRRYFGKLRGASKLFHVLLDPENGRKYFYKVRKLHGMAQRRVPSTGNGTPIPEKLVWKEEPWMEHVSKAVKMDLEEIQTTPEEENKFISLLSWEGSLEGAVSQFDMAYITTAFFGPVWLLPNKYGMKDGKDDEKMKDFIHAWAVIVRLLGLRDEFNIYINPRKEVIDRIVKDVFVTSMKNIDNCLIHLADLTVSGVKEYFPLITLKSGLLMVLVALGCKRKGHLWNIMGFKDKAIFFFQAGVALILAHSRLLRHANNYIFALWMDYVSRKILNDVRERG